MQPTAGELDKAHETLATLSNVKHYEKTPKEIWALPVTANMVRAGQPVLAAAASNGHSPSACSPTCSTAAQPCHARHCTLTAARCCSHSVGASQRLTPLMRHVCPGSCFRVRCPHLPAFQEYGFHSHVRAQLNPQFTHYLNTSEITSYASSYIQFSGKSPFSKKSEVPAAK
jgi:hypothetical protein